MRICLAFCDNERDLFLSERGQYVFIICSLLKSMGHLVGIRPVGEVAWWSTAVASGLAEMDDLKDNVSYDFILDIGGSVHPQIRKEIAKTVIVFLYNNVLFDELQTSAYITKNVERHLERDTVDQIWIWEGQEDSCAVLSSLYHCSVRCVPFVWSPLVIQKLFDKQVCEAGGVEDGGVEVEAEVKVKQYSKDKYIIFQTNKDNTMSSVWPLSFLNERRAAGGDIHSCTVYDFEEILEKSKFYKENIEKNLSYSTNILYKQFESLEELYMICSKGTTIFHTRYKPYQIHIFNFMWMGLPLIHNSPILKKGYTCWNYFQDNSFSDADRSLETVNRVFSDKNIKITQMKHMRTMLESSWSFEKVAKGWKDILTEIPVTIQDEKKIVSFSDMWEGFDVKDNFFIDLLKSRGICVEGVLGPVKNADLHICGPFGMGWQFVPAEIPIVFFSGERWVRQEVYEKSRISLFLTHDTEEDDRHMRLPLWILFLELWDRGENSGENRGEGVSRRNPNGLPLSLAIERKDGWKDRKRFCAFVVSNPMNLERNTAFDLLNAFEDVDSGGAYKNNIGGPIEHMYGGGGGGDRAKHAFLEDRKFCLCYENSSAPGYVTEKLLHAKLAGCIPIYWGCKEAAMDFDPRGFIDMTDVPVNDIVSRIEEFYHDEEAGNYMATIPALGQKELEKMWSCVERVGDKLCSLLNGYKGVVKHINKVKVDIMDSSVTKNIIIEPTVETFPVPLFVSFATKKFLSSIEYALEGVKGFKEPRIEYLLYIGGDVEECDISGIRHMYGDILTIRKLPVDTLPAGDTFPDFWNPRHFGWKIWIYNQIVREFRDRLLIFSDAGAQWIKMYPEMFEKAWKSGICFVVDKDENKNRFWCSEEMISEMKVTEEELEVPQILGGIMAIRGGHEGAMAFFEKCLNYAYNPRILRGRKLIRVLPGGQPVGHRHDQSIMSVERVRSGRSFEYVPEYLATCMLSLRDTYNRGTPIYLHRGNYISNSQAFQHVDDVWIINLEKRLDRLISFSQEYPTLSEIVHRFAGIDGRLLQMTPAIQKLFTYNDFQWKKSVLGCALSHILVWAQLACEGPGVNSYLILEDDVRFTDPEKIDTVLGELPVDTELAYLGGVLPRNREVYSKTIESVNSVWSSIVPNIFFSKQPMPIFHHCAYAYYLTKTGAQKLLASLTDLGLGCFTSIDHYLGHPMIGLVKYVLKEPIATCFQDKNPVYANAAFDDFGRVDSYDSDIWNNNEVYKVNISKDIIERRDKLVIPSLYPIICDVLRQIPSSRETCTILSPGPFVHMLKSRGRDKEILFTSSFLQQLQAETKMPGLISFERRVDSMVVGSVNDISGCKTIQTVFSSGDNFKKACLMSKMFLVEAGDINNVIKTVASTGCIPIYIRHSGDDAFWKSLKVNLGLVELSGWIAANKFISILLADVEKGEKYRWGIVERCLQALSSARAEAQAANV